MGHEKLMVVLKHALDLVQYLLWIQHQQALHLLPGPLPSPEIIRFLIVALVDDIAERAETQAVQMCQITSTSEHHEHPAGQQALGCFFRDEHIARSGVGLGHYAVAGIIVDLHGHHMGHVDRDAMISGLFARRCRAVAMFGPEKISMLGDVVVLGVSAEKLLIAFSADALVYEISMWFGLAKQGIKSPCGAITMGESPEISQALGLLIETLLLVEKVFILDNVGVLPCMVDVPRGDHGDAWPIQDLGQLTDVGRSLGIEHDHVIMAGEVLVHDLRCEWLAFLDDFDQDPTQIWWGRYPEALVLQLVAHPLGVISERDLSGVHEDIYPGA